MPIRVGFLKSRGHLAQLPTVIQKANRSQVIDASLKRSYLWKYFKVMKLNENMRIKNNGNDQEQINFDNWLFELGEDPHCQGRN